MERLVNYNTEKSVLNKSNLFWVYTNDILNKNLDEIKKIEPNIILVDPLSDLYTKNKSDFFKKDGLHLNINGNRIIAKNIFNSLVLNKIVNN